MSTPTPAPTLTGHRRVACGCDIQQHGEHYTIQQCPLHAQAPAMREALKECEEAMIVNDFPVHHKVLVKVHAILTQIEGKE